MAADIVLPADDFIPLIGRPYVERGMDRETVTHMLGAPSAKLSDDVWVYFDFTASNPARSDGRNEAAAPCDTLVIGFAKDRIVLIRACESQPVRALLAQLAKSPAAKTTMAKK